MKLTYILQGDPIPLMRPRLTKYGIWDPQNHLKEELRTVLQLQHGSEKLINGPIELQIVFFMQIPMSWSKKKKDLFVGKDHIARPDTSNLLKFYEDILTGLVYHDDCIISRIYAKKLYALEPRTEITLREIDEANQKSEENP